MKIKSFLLVTLAFVLLVTGCTATPTAPTPQVTPTRAPAVKPDIDYSVLNMEIGRAGKCILEIELPDRISEDEVTRMAYYLSENEGKDCAPLFIFYYLPGQERKYELAWAYSHFNPDLQVKISDAQPEN
ncbi:hypothetical protein LARV_00778 [Longilinea arvoryzae]|uniref:Lipoprotein n=1 Tax=Longilinea arvoryzae TaxID=360412 RepID=A0A0S7BCL8_9CHLR|nr:hypothetical protein [Longilinea arvoryzae]GAP13037.1 hypothetical protein LARV_00778 [Longilinea arvoryzae]